MRETIIKENESGQRLDKYLKKYLPQAPGSFIYKMLRKKNITLNGKKAAGQEKLNTGDSIKFFLAEETIDKFAGNAAVIISPVLKNNGIERIGLSIQGNESNVCPVIYLEYYYESYQSGI